MDRPPWYRDEESLIAELQRGRRRSAAPEIPGYEEFTELQRGGQGIVYSAMQRSTSRRVAVKLLLEGSFASHSARRRFEREIDLVATLRHPNVVRIYDSGETRDGRSFFVMEFIEGKPLDEFAEDLTLEQRLQLLAKVADAVHYAHQRGVIHRDLKPSNIRVDQQGEPHVLDFGAARAAEGQVGVTLSAAGQFIGSLPWASPEHAGGELNAVEVRSDVYSLGVLLYQVLTGRFPYDVDGSFYDTLQNILHAGPAPPTSVALQIDHDVEAIVLKALAKEPERRYQSAGELGDDIRRYLRQEVVVARLPSQIYQIRMFVRRNVALCGAVAAVILVSVGAVVVSTVLLRGAETARAHEQHRRYASLLAAAESALRHGDHATARQQLDLAPPELRRQWEWRHLEVRVDGSLETLVKTTDSQRSVAWTADGSVIAAGGEDGIVRLFKRSPAGWERSELALAPDDCEAVVGGVALARMEGAIWLAAGGMVRESPNHPRRGVVRIWDVTDLAGPKDLIGPWAAHKRSVHRIALHPGKRLLATVGIYDEARLWRLSPEGAELASTLRHDWTIRSVAFNERGDRLATAGDDMTARVFDVSDPAAPRELVILRGHDNYVKDVAFRPGDNDVLATASIDGTVRLWDLAASEQQRDEQERRNGRDNATGVLLDTLRGHTAGLYSLAFSADGRLLASGGADRVIKIWELRDDREIWEWPERGRSWTVPLRRELTSLHGHMNTITSLAFGPGDQLVSSSWDGTVRCWSAQSTGAVPTLLGHRSSVHAVGVAKTHEGRTIIASGSGDWSIKLWDAERCEGLATLVGHGDAVSALAIDARGTLLASGSMDSSVRLWDISNPDAVGDPRILQNDGYDDSIMSLALHPEGRFLAAGGKDGTVFLWDLGPPQPVLRMRFCGGDCLCNVVAFDPKGRWLVAGFGAREGDDCERVARVWDLDNDRQVQLRHQGGVTAAAFSPCGRFLVTGTSQGRLILWKTAGGRFRQIRTIDAHAAWIEAIEFHPKARELRLASSSGDRTIRLWKVEDSSIFPTAILRGHIGWVDDLAFSPDGALLVSASTGFEGQDNSVKLWESHAADEERRKLLQVRGRARELRRAAEPLVEQAFQQSVSADEAVRNLSGRAMDADLRDAAIALARFEGDRLTLLRRSIWRVVKRFIRSDAAHSEYAQALLRAQHMMRMLPEAHRGGAVRLTLGLAEYRTGSHRDAEKTLTAATEELDRPGDVGVYLQLPCAEAALAMTLHMLEKHDAARAALERAGRHMDEFEPVGGREHYPRRDALALFAEAEQMLARCPKCSERLVDSEHGAINRTVP